MPDSGRASELSAESVVECHLCVVGCVSVVWCTEKRCYVSEKDICNCAQVTPLGDLSPLRFDFNPKTMESHEITVVTVSMNSKRNQEICNHVCRDGTLVHGGDQNHDTPTRRWCPKS